MCSIPGYAIKHPILLPKRHHFVKLIVFHYHEMSHHSENSYVSTQIRQMFWIVNGQSTVRFSLKTCFYCSLRRAKAVMQVMAPLPLQRITGGERPFSITGVDFFRPEWVNEETFAMVRLRPGKE